MRTALLAIYWGGLACVAAMVAVIGLVLVTHPRNESGYLTYVRMYRDFDAQHPPKASKASQEELVAAGDRACDWLFHQPPGLWRVHAPYLLSDLDDAYSRTMSAADRALPRSVVPGAWAFLCPATRVLVRPYDLLRNRDD